MATVGHVARSEDKSALLQRILWSRQIERSARIRDFLVYVCDKALAEPSAEIHEQEIGVKVFGRKAGYDTAADNVVRVTASQARRKIETYFATDGALEPVVLEIPKGQYTPVFHERTVVLPETPLPEEPPPPMRGSRAIPILVLCVILLGIISIWLAIKWRSERAQVRSQVEANPSISALWSQLLTVQGRTDIVLPDSSLSLIQELLNRQLTLAEYLNPGEWVSEGEYASNPELRNFARLAEKRHLTSMASVTGVYRIAQLAGRDHSRVSIFSARDFNIREMKSDNVVLLGSIRANPWGELIQDRLNFQFGFDQQLHHSYFDNRDPKNGESKTYRTDSTLSLCHIAFLPNLDRTGNILSIAGTEVEGTEGGIEFVTTERSLAQLTKIAKPEHGQIPYFEMLLKSSRVGGVSPSFSIVAVRLLHL
jgi:hypothetical protein